jgi:guanylate kinase
MSGRGRAAARLRRSVSVTTRAKRAEEQEGQDYFFVSPEEFQRLATAGELLEWATYLDHRYGTPREWVDQQLAAGYDVVLEIEVAGAMQVRERRPEAVLIYMLPPSRAALRRRLARRRSESPELQQRRLEVAQREMAWVPRYDYVIVNGRVGEAARLLLAILETERCRVGRAEFDPLLEVSGG